MNFRITKPKLIKCGGVHHRHAFQHPPHRPWRIMWRIQQNGPMVSVSIHRKLPSQFNKTHDITKIEKVQPLDLQPSSCTSAYFLPNVPIFDPLSPRPSQHSPWKMPRSSCQGRPFDVFVSLGVGGGGVTSQFRWIPSLMLGG